MEDTCHLCSDFLAQIACAAIFWDDVSQCERLEWGGAKFEGAIDECKALLIEARCSDITDYEQRQECYVTQAYDLRSFHGCLLVQDDDNKNLCLAGVTDDKDYCERIINSEKMQRCLEALGEAPEEAGEEEQQEEQEQVTPDDRKMESLQVFCDQGGYSSREGDERWRCIDGKPVQVKCPEH